MAWDTPPPDLPRGLWVALAGAAGALAARIALRDRSVTSVVVAVTSGALTAYYVAPAAAHWLRLGESGVGALGFVSGICGMYAIPALVDIARDPIGAWRRFTAPPQK